uniref:Uncharacterized protein n=1 Tax=viral metagenome TaxID=1070528 RepID=A0A6M3LG63_9ZZZZ
MLGGESMTKKIILSPVVPECRAIGCRKIAADGLCAVITLPHTMWERGKKCWAGSTDPLWEDVVRQRVAEYTLTVEVRKSDLSK